MVRYKQPKSIVPNVPADEFFKNFVSRRRPAIIKGLLDDEDFKARQWTDLRHLAMKAGDSSVLVEPMHPESRQFGTDVERISMSFREFLKSLKNDDGPHHYLTTQYAEQDMDALTVLPPPTDALAADFPFVPRLMGNLLLQQVNLWVGRSKNGSTSGLHHDFHDNLYCLLKGKKRFVLFPPTEYKHLYPYGKLDALHPNGLISYTDAPVRADGLPLRLALKTRVKALEEQLSAPTKGKGKARQDTKAREALLEAHEQAMDELAQYTLDNADDIGDDEEVDDFDALSMAGLGGEDDFDAMFGADGAEDPVGEDDVSSGQDDDDDSEDDEVEEWTGLTPLDDEPSSFSRTPTALVHQHLSLPTTAAPPKDVSITTSFPDFNKVGEPLVVELSAGEMLYLPASWWHEVTSSSAGTGEDAVHMAFNYWFYPPDNLGSFEQPYADTLVWDYLRHQAAAREKKGESSGKNKRKANGDEPRAKKKSKQ